MKKILLGALLLGFLYSGCKDEKEDSDKTGTETASAMADAKKPATEVLDLSEADGVKAAFDAFAKGDIEGMTANYDDNIRYFWSGGDSLVGKQAVKDYYTGRWKLIDSLNFSENIRLPIRINESQSPQYARVGKWVLAWNFVHVKYKNNKRLDFWVHTDYHFNDAGKVDVAVQYIDFRPLMEATKGMTK